MREEREERVVKYKEIKKKNCSNERKFTNTFKDFHHLLSQSISPDYYSLAIHAIYEKLLLKNYPEPN